MNEVDARVGVAIGVQQPIVVSARGGRRHRREDETLKLGVSLPLSGGAAADGQPTLKGAQLAADQANAAGRHRRLHHQGRPARPRRQRQVQRAAGRRRHARPSSHDPKVFGVVGPYNSAVAKVQIPISNAAGLLQCSPANTNETLTKPEFGALDLRKTNPDKINYIRVAATDDIQGPAMARLRLQHARPQEHPDRRRRHDLRQGRRRQLREEVRGARRHGRPAPGRRQGHHRLQRDHQHAAVTANAPDGVYYGGVVTSGGGLFLKQLRQAGLTIPFIGPGRHRQRRRRRQGLADQHRRRRGRGELVRHGRRDRRLPGQEGLRRGVHRALQGRRGVQDPGRVLAARRMPAPRSSSSRSRQTLDGQRRRRRRGHPRGRPRLRDRPGQQVRHGPRRRRRSTRTATPPSRSSPSTSPIRRRQGRRGDWVFKEQQNFAGQ